MRISEPIFIRRTEKRGYQAIGRLPGCGTITRYGRSEEEAKRKFFEACDERAGDDRLTGNARQKALLTVLFATIAAGGAESGAPGPEALFVS